MTQEESLKIVVREAVRETLTGLGFDMHDPPELQADMHYLRRMRRGSEDMTKILRHSIFTLLISSGMYLLWTAFKVAVLK